MNEKPEMPPAPGVCCPLIGSNPATENPAASSGSLNDETASKKDFDPRSYRPLDVTVSITMHDIQAHLVKVSCSKSVKLY